MTGPALELTGTHSDGLPMRVLLQVCAAQMPLTGAMAGKCAVPQVHDRVKCMLNVRHKPLSR